MRKADFLNYFKVDFEGWTAAVIKPQYETQALMKENEFVLLGTVMLILSPSIVQFSKFEDKENLEVLSPLELSPLGV